MTKEEFIQMNVEQFVMAYGVEQDRLRAMLPEGFHSLRPVLRINAEIWDGRVGWLELNTAVEADGKRGWLNIDFWQNIPFIKQGDTVLFQTDFLRISFTRTGAVGSCPAERDNDGCFFLGTSPALRPPEPILANKAFCSCTFSWHFGPKDAHGVSIDKTLPAIPTVIKTHYPKQACSAKHAAAIPCEQVLGSYAVTFPRNSAYAPYPGFPAATDIL